MKLPKGEKLPERDRRFWTTFFSAFCIFIGVWLVMSFIVDTDSNVKALGFQGAFDLVGFWAILNVCYRIGMRVARNEEIDELEEKEGLSPQEFRAKYEPILEITRKYP